MRHCPELLERAEHLATLRDAFAAVVRGPEGVLVLVGGEAGGGKTALVRRFCTEVAQPESVLWGGCDPLFTPRPMGPFLDIAALRGGDLVDLLQSSRPYGSPRG